MTRFTDVTGLASSVLVVAAGTILLSGIARIPRPFRLALAGIAAIAILIPIDGPPIAAAVRAAIGDPSITSLVLLVSAIRTSLGPPPPLEPGSLEPSAGEGTLHLLIGLTALGFYPLALGLGTFDPYRAGYGNPWFLAVLLIVAVLALVKRRWLPAIAIPLAVLAWAWGWYESPNLWDYLLDPLVATYAIGALAWRGYASGLTPWSRRPDRPFPRLPEGAGDAADA